MEGKGSSRTEVVHIYNDWNWSTATTDINGLVSTKATDSVLINPPLAVAVRVVALPSCISHPVEQICYVVACFISCEQKFDKKVPLVLISEECLPVA